LRLSREQFAAQRRECLVHALQLLDRLGLSLDSQEGREYWAAMELLGRYAAANHALIHKHVAANLGAEVLLDLENHHNFAWKERHVIETNRGLLFPSISCFRFWFRTFLRPFGGHAFDSQVGS